VHCATLPERGGAGGGDACQAAGRGLVGGVIGCGDLAARSVAEDVTGEIHAAAAEEEATASASLATMATMADAGRYAAHVARLLAREDDVQEAVHLCGGAGGQLLEELEGTPDGDQMFQEAW